MQIISTNNIKQQFIIFVEDLVADSLLVESVLSRHAWTEKTCEAKLLVIPDGWPERKALR